MPETVCNTSPIQYLHQVGLLGLLPTLYANITLAEAVAQELAEGRAHGVSLPAPASLGWIRVTRPRDQATLRMVADLGPGERETLALALEMPGSLVVLDDALARRYARLLNLRLTGTLGVLLRAKSFGHLPSIRPVLDTLGALRFRLDPATRLAVLRLAGESQ